MKPLMFITFILLVYAGKLNAQDYRRTLKNLQNAYGEEANAANRYDLFSRKATEEGFHEVAELFCAASTAENIQSMNHKEAIESLGGTPEPIAYEEVKLESTKKNLKEAIKDKANERRYTYSLYLRDAQKEGASIAAQSFFYAGKAEEDHETLFKDALKELGSNIREDYYVSNITGETVEANAGAPAPEPNQEGEAFMKIEL